MSKEPSLCYTTARWGFSVFPNRHPCPLLSAAATGMVPGICVPPAEPAHITHRRRETPKCNELEEKKKCGAQASVWACNITALLCLARFDPNQCIMTLYSVQARLAGPPPFLLEPIDRIDGPKSGPLRSAATARFWSHDLQKSALVARNDEGAFCIVWGPEKKGGWGT